MSRQFEQPQYPHDGEGLQQARLFAHPLAHVGVEAKRSRQIDDVHRGSDKLENVGGNLERSEISMKDSQTHVSSFSDHVRRTHLSS